MPYTLMYGPTLTVEAALSASTGTYGAWNAGLWDTATWGPDILWTDITDYVETVNTSRRFSRDLQAWEAGQATIVLNNADGRFSPSNLSSPYVTAGVTQVRPWRPVRVSVSYLGVSYPIYTGYALAWQETYTEPYPGGGGAFVTVPCTDEFGRLAGFDGLEVAAVGAGETSGRRMHRILDNAGHTGVRSIDLGRFTMAATTLRNNVVVEAKLTADSEGGAVWIEADGSIVFHDQLALLEKTRSNTIQAVYGDGAGEISYSDIELAYNGDLIANIISFSRFSGTVQTVSDATSRALYGDRRTTRTDLVCETDSQAAALAAIWLARYKDPEQRVTRVTLRPRGDATVMFPDVLGRRVRDLVRVKRQPPGGYTITRDSFVAGISHEISKDSWSTSLDLWSATPYTSFATSVWGTGTWDSATWFY